MPMRTINEVATHYNVSYPVVWQWIKEGTMGAIDVSRKGSSHRHWRVSDDHLAEFDRKRNSTPQPKQAKRRKRHIPNLV
jgi:transposase